MKQETVVLLAKGACYITIGGLTPLTTGLGQWIDTGEWPPLVNWVVIGAGCLVGAATQLLSFLSQSYGNWKLEIKTNGNGTLK
jgi:hypothetical protein